MRPIDIASSADALPNAEKPITSAGERILHTFVFLEELARIPSGVGQRAPGADPGDPGSQRMVGRGHPDCASLWGTQPQQEAQGTIKSESKRVHYADGSKVENRHRKHTSVS